MCEGRDAVPRGGAVMMDGAGFPIKPHKNQSQAFISTCFLQLLLLRSVINISLASPGSASFGTLSEILLD